MNLPQGKKIQSSKAIGHTKDANGDTVGKYNENTWSNSILYDVDLPDVKTRHISYKLPPPPGYFVFLFRRKRSLELTSKKIQIS